MLCAFLDEEMTKGCLRREGWQADKKHFNHSWISCTWLEHQKLDTALRIQTMALNVITDK